MNGAAGLCPNAGGIGGQGGSSFTGAGGLSSNQVGGGTTNGIAGTGYGSGGSGGIVLANNPAATGGPGKAGAIIIYEYK
jgi:hypothetical protein